MITRWTPLSSGIFAKQLANIPEDKGVQRVIMPRPPSFLEQLMSSGGADDSETRATLKQREAIAAALPEDARRAFLYLQLLDRAKNGDVLYRLPFDLRIR